MNKPALLSIALARRLTQLAAPGLLAPGLLAAATGLLGAGCGPADNLQAFDVELQVVSDCTQVAQNAVQCTDEEELAAVTRSGRWYVEDLGGANALNPLNNFILTTDRGRSITGVHFANTGALAETESCKGEGGECYFAQTREDFLDEVTACQETFATAFDFRIEADGTLVGLGQDVRIADEGCGTPSVGQVLTGVTGLPADDTVLARETQ